jgi:FMN phosphatase YigB (HAD superfamily)
MNRLCTVTIDCWDTILVNNNIWDNGIRGQIFDFLKAESISCSREDVQKAFDREDVWFSDRLMQHQVAETAMERTKRLLAELRVDLSSERTSLLCSLIASEILRPPPPLIDGAREFCRDIVAKGLKLGLIANTGWFSGAAITSALRWHSMHRIFSALVFSDEIGSAKPSHLIFDEAMKRLETKHGDTVHIGDNPSTDIAGALGAGMLAIHFSGVNAAKTDLCPSFRRFGEISEYIDNMISEKR